MTTHKIDLLDATRDMFDYLDPLPSCAARFRVSPSAMDGWRVTPRTRPHPGWHGRPLSSPVTGGHVMCIGAGGSAVAISVYVAGLPDPADCPPKFITVNRSQPRLDRLKAIHTKLDTNLSFEYILNENPARNDEIMASLPSGSMVINATGMGKDRPGSPITNNGLFPEGGLVWELNYRGGLGFLHQAERQAKNRNLKVEDGCVYFLHGWTQVLAEVFRLDLTPDLFDEAASPVSPQRLTPLSLSVR